MQRLLFLLLNIPFLGLAAMATNLSTDVDNKQRKTNNIFNSLELKTFHFSSELEKTNKQILELYFEEKYQAFYDSNINLKANMSLEAGSSEASTRNIYQVQNHFSLKEANIEKTFEKWNLQLGTLYQKIWNQSLLVGSTGFLGLKESYRINSNFNISAQQSIANNQSLSSRIGKINEQSPSFFFYQLNYSKENKNNLVNINIGSFNYQHLSSSVAHQSRFLGNTINGISNKTSKFSYEFNGFALNSSYTVKSFLNSFTFYGQYLNNTSAFKDTNQAYLLGFSGSTKLKNQQELSFGIEKYKKEADSAPAYYSDLNYINNSIGARLNLKWTVGLQSLILDIINSQSIIDNPFSSNQKSVSLSYWRSL